MLQIYSKWLFEMKINHGQQVFGKQDDELVQKIDSDIKNKWKWS